MLLSVFSSDSRFFRYVSRCADLIVLNLLFLAACLPLFTIGPAVTAMYTVAFSLGTHREQGIVAPFLRGFFITL